MKHQKVKVLFLLLILSSVFVLHGCEVSKEVQNAINAIDAIGRVTHDSASVIEFAENIYSNLTEAQKQSVDNYHILQDAKAVKAAIAAIDAIGKVTHDSASVIEFAENVYNSLTETQKQSVVNYQVLQDAQDAIEKLERDSRVYDIFQMASGMLIEEDYIGVYKLLNALSQDYKTDNIDSLLNTAIDCFKNEILFEADSQSALGDYNDAIELLVNANKKIPLSEFDDAIWGYENSRDIAFLQGVKNDLAISFDRISNNYYIAPKGLVPGTITFEINSNLYHILSFNMSTNTPIFQLALAFYQSDWMFMDNIIIDCDGTQFTYDVGFNDRITQIGQGNIAEMYAMQHSESNSINSNSQFQNLKPTVESIITSDVVTIRFSGSTSKKDVIIPNTQKAQLDTIWNVFKILNRNGSLISHLI